MNTTDKEKKFLIRSTVDEWVARAQCTLPRLIDITSITLRRGGERAVAVWDRGSMYLQPRLGS